MAWELERFLVHLLMRISCAGESGCSLKELLEAICDSSAPSGSSSQDTTEPQPNQAACAVWKWLTERSDVSVGRGRKYNHLTLSELLTLPHINSPAPDRGQRRGGDDKQTAERVPDLTTKDTFLGQEDIVRVYTSEATMWEVITGHAVDHKRIPRSEWLLLLGIASSKSNGILQGDLGRLVDQDKRSVPKRTESLVKKGYICKRTTLVRGTKTSKMWLRSFAPPLPKEHESIDIPRTDIDMLRHHSLAENLDPVPWRDRWTGHDIDYIAMATTIMAVTKEWDVIRVRDLKAKLGVLDLRWQMKVVSKTCRFLNSRGAIQFVAAKLDNRVFKDCVKFRRDMNPEDWSMYLATGRRSGKTTRGGDLITGNGWDEDDQLNIQRANNARLGFCSPWTLDKPLPHTIARLVHSLGDNGLSNPDIYALTLGATFNRFISSMTGSLSTSGMQPSHLQHLQMRSEHVRAGKVASYLFFLPSSLANAAATEQSELQGTLDMEKSLSLGDLYGHLPIAAVPTLMPSSLPDAHGFGLPQTPRGKAMQRQWRSRKHASQTPDVLNSESTEVGTGTLNLRVLQNKSELQQSPDKLVTSKLRPETEHTPTIERKKKAHLCLQDSSLTRQTGSAPESAVQLAEHNNDRNRVVESVSAADSIPLLSATAGQGRRRGQIFGSKRGRGRSHGRQPLAAKFSTVPRPWKCEKCGGSWKNEVGLKYHLGKSQTTCNPSHSPPVHRTSRKGGHAGISRPPASTGFSDEMRSRSPEGISTPFLDIFIPEVDGESVPPSQRSHQAERQLPEHQTRTEEMTGSSAWRSLGMGSALVLDPPIRPGVSPEAGGLFPPQSDPNVLLRGEARLMRQITAPKSRGRSVSLVDGQHGKDNAPSLDELAQEARAIFLAPDTHSIGRGGAVRHGQVQLSPSRISSRNALIEASRLESMKPEQTKMHSISLLIKKFLGDSHGVILGGKCLWHAVTAAWPSGLSDMPHPTERECQSSVNSLLRKKDITEHWHAFRDRKGLFAKCQLILRPGVDAFSRESLALVEQAKDAASVLDASSQRETSDIAGTQAKKHGVRGRRLLAKEIAILDAPVYAAQLAAKRVAEAPKDDLHRFKRLKYSTQSKCNDGDGQSNSLAFQEPSMFAVSEMGNLNMSSASDALAGAMQLTRPMESLRFLEPNAYLDDEPYLPDSSVPPRPMSTPPQQQELQKPAQRRQLTRVARCEGYVFDSLRPIFGPAGTWPWFDPQEFDQLGTISPLSGWIPDARWLKWADFIQEVQQRFAAQKARKRRTTSRSSSYEQFIGKLQACYEAEVSWKAEFISAMAGEAGPHIIFVRIFSPPSEDVPSTPLDMVWRAEKQLSVTSANNFTFSDPEVETTSTENELNLEGDGDEAMPGTLMRATPMAGAMSSRQSRAKRVTLVTRSLTALPAKDRKKYGRHPTNIQDPDEVMAAFIAVRSLLGGADKAIDWGLLMRIFPKLGLAALRKFWVDSRKQQAAYISNFTRVFQERLIPALECDEIPMIDFEQYVDYDWRKLINWTMQLPRQEGFQMPGSRESISQQYWLEDLEAVSEDWREKFFHVLSSFYARYEAITSEPGAVSVGGTTEGFLESSAIDDLVVARSWIKSSCCPGATRLSIEDMRNKFLEVSPNNRQRRSHLFKTAVAQLTKQRVICRSQKTRVGGQPYRLSEWYSSTLARLAQNAKYDAAAAFKEELDVAFRKQKSVKVPYTLNEGAMMALTNMNATGRIHLTPVGVPDIPFGFEPGNYESRKYPKSYYHFALEVGPTKAYQYNEEIEVLRNVARAGPPTGGSRGELPQWIDLSGESNVQRWSEILGAFSFALATRGPMTIEGICSALSPLLEDFEARLMVDWGRQTGLLADLINGMGTTVTDWWWLAVPWLRRRKTLENMQEEIED